MWRAEKVALNFAIELDRAHIFRWNRVGFLAAGVVKR